MILCLGTTPAVQRTMSFARIALNDVNRATSVADFASGKSVNVARVLSALGEEVLATGIIGGDSGVFLREDLSRAHIAHDFVESPTPTRTCVTMLDESAGSATELIEEAGDPGPDAFDELLNKLAELVAGAKALVLSGSLAPGAGDDFYAGCIRLARDAGAATIVDAAGNPLRRALGERPTIVKPNRDELANTLGVTLDTDMALYEAMRRVSALGAEWIVVTAGAADTIISDGKDFWRLLTPPIKPINPIGSGDAFAAGLAAGIVREMEIPQACRLAVACGVANAVTTRAGHVDSDDVEALFDRIDVVMF